jgi:Cu2+-containing amine oxidase
MAPAKKPVKAAKPAKAKPKSAERARPGKPVPAKPIPAKTQAAAKPVKAAKPSAPDVERADPTLFDPLTPGEIADALRTLTEDRRLSSMAKVGRYRVICTEPLVVKPPHWMAGHRLARVVAYDYAADRSVDACVDLDAGVVAHLELTKAQPMLSRDEEALAVSIAMVDDRVREKLALGDIPQSTMHYWGRTAEDIAYARRSAAVVFGRADGHASVVAVVDLIEHLVTQVVPAELW